MTAGLVASSGATVAVMVTVLPTLRMPSVLSRVIPSTLVVTVTLVVALSPSGTTPNAESRLSGTVTGSESAVASEFSPSVGVSSSVTTAAASCVAVSAVAGASATT